MHLSFNMMDENEFPNEKNSCDVDDDYSDEDSHRDSNDDGSSSNGRRVDSESSVASAANAVQFHLADLDGLKAIHLLRRPKPMPLTEGYTPNGLDVCSGRGKSNWNHEGNVHFRNVIRDSVDRYIKAPTKNDKTMVVISIVDEIRRMGGKFLKQDAKGNWYDIGDDQARDKVGHSLRDQVTSLNKKSKEGSQEETEPVPLNMSQEEPEPVPLYSSQEEPESAPLNSSQEKPEPEPLNNFESAERAYSDSKSPAKLPDKETIVKKNEEMTVKEIKLHMKRVSQMYREQRRREREARRRERDSLLTGASATSNFNETVENPTSSESFSSRSGEETHGHNNSLSSTNYTGSRRVSAMRSNRRYSSYRRSNNMITELDDAPQRGESSQRAHSWPIVNNSEHTVPRQNPRAAVSVSLPSSSSSNTNELSTSAAYEFFDVLMDESNEQTEHEQQRREQAQDMDAEEERLGDDSFASVVNRVCI